MMTKSAWKFVRIALVVAATSGCAGTRPKGTFVSDAPGRSPSSAPAASTSTASNAPATSDGQSVPTKTRILREVPLEGAFAPTPTANLENSPTVTQAEGTVPNSPNRVIPVDAEVIRGRNPLVDNLLSDDAELRIATLQVIRDAIRDGFDFSTDTPDAEGVNLVMTLRWMAYGYEKDGTWVEPVDAVRALAMATLGEADPSPASLAFNRPFCVDDAMLPAQAAEVLTADTKDAFPSDGNPPEATTDSTSIPTGSVARLGSDELREMRQEDDAPQITPKTIPLDEPTPEDLELVGSVPTDDSEMPSTADSAHEIQITAGPRQKEIVSVDTPSPETPATETPATDTPATETSDVLPELNDPSTTGTAGPAETPSEPANIPAEPEIAASESLPTTPETPIASVATDEPRMTAPTEAETARKTIPLEEDARADSIPEPSEPLIARTPPEQTAPPEQVAPPEEVAPIAPPRVERRAPVVATPARSTNIPAPVDMTEPVPYVAAKGVICRVDTAGGTAEIRLYGTEASVPMGARFVVVHRYPLGKLSSMGEVEVIASRAGVVQVRPVGGTPLSKVAVGDRASTTATGF
jgi:hypothetical protein